MEPDAFKTITHAMLGGARPRVWSLLVSAFGDLALDKDAALAGATLSRIAELVSLKPEAVRVALHRLRKDGWIESRRAGRTTDYALTAFGRSESTAAIARIYDRVPLAEAAWLVLQDGVAAGTGVPLGPGVRLTGHAAFPDALVLPVQPGVPLPDWVQARICPPALEQHGASLADRLTTLQTTLADASTLLPIEQAALRVVVVHEWRRFVLRLPALPDHMFPESARVPVCRDMALDVLERIPRPSLDALLAPA